MKWTPGPWNVAGRGDGNQQLPIYAHGKIIAAIRDHGKLADARLIAAAPELAEACEQALWLNSNPRRDNEDEIEWQEVMSKIRAALAKAKGE
jgi:hypothetical protein